MGRLLPIYTSQAPKGKKRNSKVDAIGQKCISFEIFICVWGYSGWVAACLTEGQTQKDWLSALDQCFEKAGGVPREIICDNARALVKVAHKHAPVLADGFKRFCRHYGCIPHACAPYKPRHKALVENMVGQVQRVLARQLGSYKVGSLEEANLILQSVVDEINSRKSSIGWVRNEAMQKERQLMYPLPKVRYFEGEFVSELKIRKGNQIRYQGIRYNFEWGHEGEKVVLLQRKLPHGAYEFRVFLKDTGQLLAITNKRSAQEGHEPNDPKKLPAAVRHMAEDRHVLLERLKEEFGPLTEALGERLAPNNSHSSRSCLRGLVEQGRRLKTDASHVMEKIAESLLGSNSELSFQDFEAAWEQAVAELGIAAVGADGRRTAESNIRGKAYYQGIYKAMQAPTPIQDKEEQK